MPHVEFLVEGSKGDKHTVVFAVQDGSARATCSCKAGTNGKFCRHRIALLDGDTARLLSRNAAEVTGLYLSLRSTDLLAAFTQVKIATQAHDETKKALDAAKKRLAKVARK